MQIVVNGAVNGLAIALVALGFACAYLPTRAFHVALGGVYLIAPFIAWEAMRHGVPLVIAAVLGAVAGGVVSLTCEVVTHWPLQKRAASTGAHLIASLGVYIALVQGVVLIWGSESKVLRSGLDSSYQLGPATLSGAQFIVATTATIAMVGFGLWLWYSNLGLQLRGLADNPNELALRGFNVRVLRCLGFGLAGLLASCASLVVAYDLGFDPQVGMSTLLLAVVAVIVGGQRSFIGPVLGGILLGVIRAEAAWILSARWQDACTFGVLVLFLGVRPQGILGQASGLEPQS